MKFFLMLMIMTAIYGCSQESATNSIPVPVGQFSVEGPFCHSTGQKPHYPEPKFAAALFDFDNLTSKTLTRRPAHESPFLVEEYVAPGCTLRIHRSYISLVDELFGASRARTFFWTPAGCQMEVSGLDASLPIGADYNSLYTNSGSNDLDLVFEVTSDGDTYNLATPKSEPLGSSWSEFGCLPSDQILFRLTKI
jgi:hypothetical protein